MSKEKNIKLVKLYCVVVVILSLPIYILVVKSGKSADLKLIRLLMFVPAISALVVTIFWKGDWRVFGFHRLGKISSYILALLIPLVACITVYGFVWSTGIGKLDTNSFFFEKENWYSNTMDTISYLAIGILLTTYLTAGEEIGWRGFMLPRLFKNFEKNFFIKSTLITAVFWALWHSPAIIGGAYSSGNSIWFTIPAFTYVVLGASFIFSFLRLRDNSFWSSVLLHSTHNSLVQDFFDPVTIDSSGYAKYITTEFGLGLGTVYFIIAYILYKKIGISTHENYYVNS